MEAGLGTTNMVWEQACQYEASWVCINWNRLIYRCYLLQGVTRYAGKAKDGAETVLEGARIML